MAKPNIKRSRGHIASKAVKSSAQQGHGQSLLERGRKTSLQSSSVEKRGEKGGCQEKAQGLYNERRGGKRGLRNLLLTGFFLMAAALGIIGLAFESSIEQHTDTFQQLNNLEASRALNGTKAVDPLAVSSSNPQFALQAVSPDAHIISYSSSLDTQQAASLFISTLVANGWTITDPTAENSLCLCWMDKSGQASRTLFVQVFAVSGKSNILVQLI